MKHHHGLVTFSLLAGFALAVVSPARAQHETHQTTSPATPAQAAPAACQEGAQQALTHLDALKDRLDRARQTNNATEMRAAMDALQSVVGELRIRLDPCRSGGAQMAGAVATAPGSAPAGMNMNMAAPQRATGAAAMAGMDHSTMGRGATPSAPPMPGDAMDLVCGVKASARHRAEYKGQMYYFCSEADRQKFVAAPEPYMKTSAPMDHSKMAMGTSTKPATAGAKRAVAAPMDHSKMAMGTPAKPAAAGAKPPAAAPMDHSKMAMGTPAQPADAGAKPPAAAPMDHSKMAMGTPAQPATAGAKPPGAAPMDHSKMAMESGAAKADPHGMTNEAQIPLVPAVRVMDPACPTADTMTAPKAVYQRKVYYFCSAKDRDQFRKDPVAFLRARPRG